MIGKLMHLPRRERIGLGGALLLVAFYILDATVASPLMARWRVLDSDIAIASARLERSKKTLSYQTSVDAQYVMIKDLIGNSATEQESIEIFKNEIDELARKNGMRLRSMRHLVPERTDFLVTFLVDVSDYEAETGALVRFLHAISQAPGLIRVRRSVINSRTPDGVINGSLLVTKVMTLAGDGVPE